MARSPKAKPAGQLSQTVNDATAAAAANVLRMAAEAQHAPDRAERAAGIARLARMCEEAADHMARAQDVLFDGHDGGEAAIGHLDAALKCLNELAAEGERHAAERDREAQSA